MSKAGVHDHSYHNQVDAERRPNYPVEATGSIFHCHLTHSEGCEIGHRTTDPKRMHLH